MNIILNKNHRKSDRNRRNGEMDEDTNDDEKFYDCEGEEEDDDDTLYNTEEFDKLCQSPPQFTRTKKRESKKHQAYKSKHSSIIHTDDTTSLNTESTTTPTTIETTSTKIKTNRANMKLSFIPSKISSSVRLDSPLQHRLYPQSKSLNRVQSLPLLVNKRKEYFKHLNRSTLNSESDSIVYDIDDDLINCFQEQQSSPNDEDDYEKRGNFYEKFSLILKFMLKPTNSFDIFRTNTTDTPSTPTTTTILTPPPQSSKNNLPTYVHEYYTYYNNNQQPTSEQLQAHSNENLWYNLYDYFVNYNKRSKTLDEIKTTLNKTRLSCVGPTIHYILNLNFDLITQSMQQDLERESLYTVSDFRRLNESPKYICKLSYLYCYIEDILNRVGYMESLYPSLKSLENEVPLYASEEFTNRIKTLLLWYNIMTDLMRQCDLFGRFLGFTKRDAYHHLWTWFDRNQNYSRRDFEKVQLMLLSSIGEPIGGSFPVLKHSKSSNNTFLSPQVSASMSKSSTYETIGVSVQPPKSPKMTRQVSFELNASKPTKNLIYNRSIDDSMIESQASGFNNTNNKFTRQNSGRSSFGSSGASISSTPLPEKLQKFFSFQSTSSSRKSNDSVPQSLYAAMIRGESFDDDDDDDDDVDSFESTKNGEIEVPIKCDNSILCQDSADGTHNHTQATRDKIYQDFIHKRLCKQGLAETCKQILNMIGNTLPRTRSALETQVESSTKLTKSATLEFFTYHWMPLHRKCRDYIAKYNNDEETKEYAINSKQFKELNLPVFRPLYLYLLNCILDLMNVCMKMYIDMYTRAHTDYNFSFSLLSTEQLTKECRECIEHAILVRQYYHFMIFSVFTKTELDKYPIENDLEKFDSDLKELINIYLKYVANWVSDTLMMNSLSLNVLEKEWNFCKNNLCYVSIGEDSYAKSFCTINCTIIESLSQYLNEIDSKYKQPLIDMLDDSLINSHGDENDEEKNMMVVSSMFELGPTCVNEHDNETTDDSNDVHYKCNELKLQIRELRDRTMKALTFCRSFMNDLELAAKYEVKSSLRSLLDYLKSDFFLVNLNNDPSFMVFVPKDFTDDKKKILRLLYMTSARDDVSSVDLTVKKQPLCSTTSTPNTMLRKIDDQDVRRHQQIRRLTSANITDNTRLNQQQFLHSLSVLANSRDVGSLPHSPQIDNGIYLLYLGISAKDQKNKDETAWKGFQLGIKASVDVKLSLFQHKTDEVTSYLYLVVAQPHLLCEKKMELKSKLRGHITLVKERTSFHPNIAAELDELNSKILRNLRSDVFNFIKSLEEETTQHFQASLSTASFPNKNLIKKFLLGIWEVSYNYAIELHIECVKFVTQGLQRDFSIGLAELCKIWCKYVLDKTEKGYGRTTKPSWARKGFQLMNEVFNPQNSQHLTNKEFDELRFQVEKCIKHIIGTIREKPIASDVVAVAHKGSFDACDANIRRKIRNLATINFEKSISLNEQQQSNKGVDNQEPIKLVHSQSSVVLRAQEFLQEQQLKTLLPPHKRFISCCNDKDDERAAGLRDNKLIGQVIYKQENIFNMNEAKINVRRVDFRWQRGNKIGSGQSGVVYACVNLDSGEMMAMKEIQYKQDDLQMIKALADEIANIEGIKHENLVQFYGVELHKVGFILLVCFGKHL
jgi:hypothetical protein